MIEDNLIKFYKLERLRNRGTSYEITISDGEQTYRVAYTPRHSRDGLLRAIRSTGKEIVTALGMPDTALVHAGKRAEDGFTLEDWQIRFSGRTQRDAISNGELQWIGAAELQNRVA